MKDPEVTENDDAMGKLFAGLFRSVKEVTSSENFSAGKLLDFFGIDEETRNTIARRQEIETFFKEQLVTIGMKDSILLTKERFNLPDDFTLKLEFTISFNLTENKTEEPNVD